ncbi:uncharacterized protein BT62DRAFT_1004792 [Guyanagaster necrorhizus]|uniref:DUF6534 domain-containing protein n=1 Tax=Guyanagaster necrorhizus TaxID=856835 RepID=A0A9P8AT96_9AGAR|nr:uncharacterized protein BT62DRAFT_1004792 [Guyanagaster necrorhizus MCA 3950]KAG7447213.1 hypothetical protein BT62DRAFT_1004792 [Guyanagaster necrorhizus MCA 3950]
MAPISVPGVNVPLITGPLILGYMWGYGLFGILTVQMYIYYIHFNHKDTWKTRLYVWLIFLLEVIFTIFSTIAAWNLYADGWGDVDMLSYIDWSWEPLPALNGTISSMVQTFYVWRIYNLTKNIWICIFIEIVAVVQCVFAYYFGIAVSVEGLGVSKLIELTPMVSTWLAGSAACDVLITSVIVYVLWQASSRSTFSQTTNAVTKIIRFTVETGLLTSVAAVVELVLWLIQPRYYVHFIGFLVLGKLYSNALVATLNSRALVFGAIQNGPSNLSRSIPHSSSSFWNEVGPKITTVGAQTVQVTRTTEIHEDDDSHEMIVVSGVKRDKNTISLEIDSNGGQKYYGHHL